MQEDFHYYATYCAAIMAGYSHEDSMQICYSAQFVDCCTRTLLASLKSSGFMEEDETQPVEQEV